MEKLCREGKDEKEERMEGDWIRDRMEKKEEKYEIEIVIIWEKRKVEIRESKGEGYNVEEREGRKMGRKDDGLKYKRRENGMDKVREED